MAARDPAERGWLDLRSAARYVGVGTELVRRAIAAGDLPAYEKPAVCRGGTRVYLKVCREDLDAWVRSWPRAPYRGEVA